MTESETPGTGNAAPFSAPHPGSETAPLAQLIDYASRNIDPLLPQRSDGMAIAQFILGMCSPIVFVFAIGPVIAEVGGIQVLVITTLAMPAALLVFKQYRMYAAGWLMTLGLAFFGIIIICGKW